MMDLHKQQVRVKSLKNMLQISILLILGYAKADENGDKKEITSSSLIPDHMLVNSSDPELHYRPDYMATGGVWAVLLAVVGVVGVGVVYATAGRGARHWRPWGPTRCQAGSHASNDSSATWAGRGLDDTALSHNHAPATPGSPISLTFASSPFGPSVIPVFSSPRPNIPPPPYSPRPTLLPTVRRSNASPSVQTTPPTPQATPSGLKQTTPYFDSLWSSSTSSLSSLSSVDEMSQNSPVYRRRVSSAKARKRKMANVSYGRRKMHRYDVIRNNRGCNLDKCQREDLNTQAVRDKCDESSYGFHSAHQNYIEQPGQSKDPFYSHDSNLPDSSQQLYPGNGNEEKTSHTSSQSYRYSTSIKHSYLDDSAYCTDRTYSTDHCNLSNPGHPTDPPYSQTPVHFQSPGHFQSPTQSSSRPAAHVEATATARVLRQRHLQCQLQQLLHADHGGQGLARDATENCDADRKHSPSATKNRCTSRDLENQGYDKISDKDCSDERVIEERVDKRSQTYQIGVGENNAEVFKKSTKGFCSSCKRRITNKPPNSNANTSENSLKEAKGETSSQCSKNFQSCQLYYRSSVKDALNQTGSSQRRGKLKEITTKQSNIPGKRYSIVPLFPNDHHMAAAGQRKQNVKAPSPLRHSLYEFSTACHVPGHYESQF